MNSKKPPRCFLLFCWACSVRTASMWGKVGTGILKLLTAGGMGL